jgi:membrane associated rhomboid family serine protease
VTARREPFLRDLLIVGGVAALLVVVHQLVPIAGGPRLALDHREPTVWSFWTAAFVHVDTTHLLSNVVGVGASGLLAASLCQAQSRGRWYLVTTIGFLTVLPVAVNLSTHLVFRSQALTPIGQGFSGVVAGYVGFVLVAHGRGLLDRYPRATALRLVQGTVLVLLATIGGRYPGDQRLLVLSLLVVALGLTLAPLARDIGARLGDGSWPGVPPEAAISVGTVVALVLFVWLLFPASPGRQTTVVNVVAHAMGLIWGVALSLLTWQLRARLGR